MDKQLSLQHALTSHRQRHSDFLHQLLDNQPQIAPVLLDAMKYAVLLGGKRIRPFLVYATGELLGASADDLDAPAAAIECIHAYSLVHDDLPAMDNDSLRRGQPTCHIAFDEATAILAGDALQTLSFEILTSHPYTAVSDRQQLQMVRTLAKASGQAGMCGGQALDLAATDRQIGLSALEQIHRHKTGALIVAAVQMAIQCSPQVSQESEQALLSWAQTIGLAFQVQDDILDETGATEALGKPQGSDQELHKSTYPALLGLTQAQQLLHDLQQKALQALAAIPYNTQLLEQFTDYLITRDR
ncbi:(2E,6E)-farnesyl diphosphate synthase [Aliidiomarina minuta]|uniref:(2E,6E)-farnesyl diphosphate synthase n=1 Tax=Aliidiomarina minuta TaxID=880057 RepID=UPI0023B92DA8|nr:(2E,6E)-farnesyl diphosphate synthase [Aliidiomarina minuta]